MTGRPREIVQGDSKRCAHCRKFKPMDHFYVDRSHYTGRQARCIVCVKVRNVETLGQRRSHLKNKYGITVEQYDEMYVKQDGKCAICGRTTEGELHEVFTVDHDHGTNEVRSLLCRCCNLGLGAFGEDLDTLRAAVRYVKKHVQSTMLPIA